MKKLEKFKETVIHILIMTFIFLLIPFYLLLHLSVIILKIFIEAIDKLVAVVGDFLKKLCKYNKK